MSPLERGLLWFLWSAVMVGIVLASHGPAWAVVTESWALGVFSVQLELEWKRRRWH